MGDYAGTHPAYAVLTKLTAQLQRAQRREEGLKTALRAVKASLEDEDHAGALAVIRTALG